MSIGLTEDHEALAASVRGLADRHVTAEAVRNVVAGGEPTFWTSLAEYGLLGLHLPERSGGQGFGLPELAVALEELGRRATPGPFLPTVLASAAIHSSGQAADLLPGLARGTLTAAVGLDSELTGTWSGEALTVSGHLSPVLGTSKADLILAPAGVGDQTQWVVLDVVDVSPLPSLDLTRGVGSVEVDAVAVQPDRILGAAPVRDLAAVLFGAEACGLAAWAVDTAASYAKVREQFGRPIGQFQGVKHKCAMMLVALEQARAAVWDAARALGEPGGGLAAGIARVLAPDAAVRCTADAIQVLGGIGYTFEHDAHLYYRRALSLRALLGDPGAAAEEVARLATGGVRRSLELDLPDEAVELRTGIAAEVAELAELDPLTRHVRMADDGWVMPHLPSPWGRDATPLEQVIIHQELRAAEVSRPNLAIGAWVIPSLVAYGSREQQERFIPSTFRGEILWCQLFSEPGAGSDLAGLSTRAERVEGGWTLTGQKIWNSLAQHAQWAICLARTDPSAPKHDGITYFLVDMSTPGIDVRPLKEITGEEIFNEVFLDDVFVPDACVVGSVNQGWRVARNTLSNERVALGDTWGPGTRYTDLVALIEKLGGLQTLRPAQIEEAGRFFSEGQSISALDLRVTLKQLAGTDPGTASSVRKLLGMQHSQRISEFCWSLCGAAGAAPADGPAEYWARMILVTRAFTIGGGTTEVQLNIIAERLLGLPRDP